MGCVTVVCVNEGRRMSERTRTIDANGAHIPAVGLGTWELRGRACARIVEQALRLGYRHVDTAQM
jgi:2,5-diketo-D-gluconate reductase B